MTYVYSFLSVINGRDNDILAKWRKIIKLVVVLLVDNILNTNNFFLEEWYGAPPLNRRYVSYLWEEKMIILYN
jgi:hypothetical protein